MKKSLLPIHILILFLTFLTVGATSAWNGTDSTAWLITLQNLLLLGLSGYAVRLALRLGIDQNFTPRHEHRIISVLILFLLFDPLTPWWVFLALGAVTELGQYFFRSPLGPIFNPAALGALILSIFGQYPAWWGVNPPPRFPLLGVEISIIAWITALGTAYVIYRYRKLAIAWSILLSYAVAYAVLFQENPTYFLLEGTLLFFTFVMACEPKTSPVPKREQVFYGILIGALAPVGLYFHFIEASLIAILLGNLYTSRRFLCGLLFGPKATSIPPTPSAEEISS